MEPLLREIKSNEGVVGSVILCRGKQDIWGDLPAAFLPEKLHSFADHVRRLAVLGDDDGGFRGMEFCYKHALVVARQVNRDRLLLTFCIPEVDVQQIHLQHSVLLPELLEKTTTLSSDAARAKTLPVPQEKKTPKKRALIFRGASYDEEG